MVSPEGRKDWLAVPKVIGRIFLPSTTRFLTMSSEERRYWGVTRLHEGISLGASFLADTMSNYAIIDLGGNGLLLKAGYNLMVDTEFFIDALRAVRRRFSPPADNGTAVV